MFFRMIKKDLKDSKGLNVIILLFMVMVSALVAASALLMFANIRGVKVSQERCKPYDSFVIYNKLLDDAEGQQKSMEDIILAKFPKAEIEHDEGIEVDYTNIYYENVDYDYLNRNSGSKLYVFMKQPKSRNLVYDQNNKPFSLSSGEMAISYAFSMQNGLKVGDEIFVTADSGKQYKFTIAAVTRDPLNDFIMRFLLSDADYEVLSTECPQKLGITGFVAGEEYTDNDRKVLNSEFAKDEKYNVYFRNTVSDGHTASNAALVSVLITFFMVITSVFMILIILFTIGFTIRSVIKKEERELGIMKALGTDSVSFRWLVAAKYIAFSVVGGIIGLFLGAVAGNALIGRFYYNISYSLGAIDYVVAALSAVLIVGLVILFILFSMRRINKISVMDVLHGEARQERIKHSDRFSLSRRRKMSLPMFLALSDIFGNFKRYILLFIAFAIGSSVVLINIQVRDTVINTNFLYKFYTWKKLEAVPNLDNKTFEELTSGTNRSDILDRNFKNIMEQNDIAATMELSDRQNAKMVFGDETETILMTFNFNPEGMVIRKGGQYPKLRNEILMDYYTASSHGVNIGDKVVIEYNKYTSDRLSFNQAQEEFVVTGFVDRLSAFNDRDVIMSAEFNDAVSEGWNLISFTLDVPESEKQAEYEKLEKVFPGQMMTDDEMIAAFLGVYDVLFSFLRNMMFVVVAGVLGFLVVMYQTVFMKDEEAEIALLMSTGVDEKTTKRWQFLRMMILFVVAMVISLLLTPTLISRTIGIMFNAMLGLTGFVFTGGVLLSIIWTIFITVFIAVVMILVTRKIRNIEIWRIRNE